MAFSAPHFIVPPGESSFNYTHIRHSKPCTRFGVRAHRTATEATKSSIVRHTNSRSRDASIMCETVLLVHKPSAGGKRAKLCPAIAASASTAAAQPEESKESNASVVVGRIPPDPMFSLPRSWDPSYDAKWPYHFCSLWVLVKVSAMPECLLCLPCCFPLS